jgi:hypothetical protein
MTKPDDTNHGADEHGRLTVTVHDEDTGGDPLTMRFGPGERVEKAIDKLYEQLNTTPRPGDRLLCEATGEAVSAHASEHLRDYAMSACAGLVWTFARDTGGA